MSARRISVLGSSGSVGVSTLDLLDQAARHGSAEVEVTALAAGRNVERLAEQALRWRPEVAVIQDESLLDELKDRLKGSGVRAVSSSGSSSHSRLRLRPDWAADLAGR